MENSGFVHFFFHPAGSNIGSEELTRIVFTTPTEFVPHFFHRSAATSNIYDLVLEQRSSMPAERMAKHFRRELFNFVIFFGRIFFNVLYGLYVLDCFTLELHIT